MTEVLIAGAGPTGLTLAIELARRGVAVRVVDKADRYAAGSRGDGMQPRTQEVFEDLGVLEQIQAAGMGAPLQRLYDGDTVIREERMADPVEPRPDVPYPNPWFVPQWRTEEILRDRLAAYEVVVELSSGVTEIAQDADGVTVTLETGETVRAAYLVGADGGKSTVRKQLGIPFVGKTDEELRIVLADVRADGLDHEFGHAWMRDQRTFAGFTPLAGGTDTYVVATSATGFDLTLEGLQGAVDAISGRTDVRLRDLTWISEWRLNERMASQFRDRRVFLAGDAAHVHSPTGGQGMNTGIQDAYNLGWKLAAVLAGAPDGLLDSYEAERLPIAAHVLGLSSEILGKHLDGADDANRRGEETYGLDLTYRDGPLALSGSGRVRGGDRAPDAPCTDVAGKPVRLYQLYAGPHWTLLRFGPTAPSIPGIPTYTVGEDLIDTEGHITKAYDVEPGTAVLVRPDNYLAALTPDQAALKTYASQVLPA